MTRTHHIARTTTRLQALAGRICIHRSSRERVPAAAALHRKQIRFTRPGKIRSALLLWLLGVPIPLILLFFMIKGCVT
ncbi:MAG: hypothetical protein QM783_16835 [Phycisphaerales bacterium]